MQNVNKASIDGAGCSDVGYKLQWFLLFVSDEFYLAILCDMDEINMGE